MSAPLLLIDGYRFDRASWDLVAETIESTLSRFIVTRKIELAFYHAEDGVSIRVTERLRKIACGCEICPREALPKAKLHCSDGVLDASTIRMIEDALICALASLATTEAAVSALTRQDWFVFTGAGARAYRRHLADKKAKRHD